jgi:uncharacterized protein YndB with AHSA1/START domain
MKVHESIEIAARPADVWAQLADPQLMADWHAKLEEVRRTAIGPVFVGERFGTTYVMSKKKQNRQDAEAEVLRCEPWTTLVLRHHFRDKGRDRYVDETFQLWPIDEGAGTRVEQTVDFSGSGLPLWAKALMWCITRTGEKTGDGILDPLRRTCEGTRAAS